jgi:hypothetical protein
MRSGCLSLLVAGCGPSIDTDRGDDGAEPTGDHGGSTGHVDPSVDTTTGATDAGSEADTGMDDPPVDTPLVPSEHVSTSISCQENGLAQVLVEVNLRDAPPTPGQCTFSLNPNEYMLIVVNDWNGTDATFDVHPDGQAVAAAGEEFLEGTVSIEVWTLEHPTIMRVDLSGEDATYQGTLDLQGCLSFSEHCI